MLQHRSDVLVTQRYRRNVSGNFFQTWKSDDNETADLDRISTKIFSHSFEKFSICDWFLTRNRVNTHLLSKTSNLGQEAIRDSFPIIYCASTRSPESFFDAINPFGHSLFVTGASMKYELF